MKCSRTLAQFAAVTMLFVGACSNPCLDLAKEVCKCEPTEAEQQACTQRVENDADATEASDKQDARCEELLETCSCDRLAEGDLAACGLANESVP